MNDTERVRDALSYIQPDSPETLLRMGEAIEDRLGDGGLEIEMTRESRPECAGRCRDNRPSPLGHAMSTPDYERARSALRFVSPDDRETWVRMGMALKDGFGDEGFDLWDGWSRQSDRYVERDARDVWKSIKRDGGITLSTLFREAKVNGWRDDGARPTPEELEARRRESAKRTARQKAEEAREHAEAASKAAQIWEGASTRADKHAYLIRKRVKAYGLRVHDGSLVVPVRNGDELRSLQYIAPDGIKKFFNGGSVSGCYFNIGDLNGAAALCICEGFATGASIHEATGLPVAVAFNAGNLLPAAKAIRERLPELNLIVCADDDARTPGNPGLTKATAAADAVGGQWPSQTSAKTDPRPRPISTICTGTPGLRPRQPA